MTVSDSGITSIGRNYVDSRTYSNTVIVKSAKDLVDIDSSKNYMIDGEIDMGDQSIEVPETGISISGLNGARDTSILSSSEDNFTMFTSPSGGYSGNVVMESMTVQVTGTNSKAFDLDNDGNNNALDIVGVNFTSCTSLGDLTDYRQLLMDNIGFIFIDDGLTFNGTWTGIRVTTAIVVVFPASTLFSAGVGFTVGNVLSDINFLSVNSASVLFDFSPSNIVDNGGFRLDEVRTIALDPLPNILGSSVKARFNNCVGFRNTYVGGQWSLTTETETTIVASNTPVKLSGTTTYVDLDHFTGDNNNEFSYIGTQEIEVEIKGTVSVSGGNNDQINLIIRRWDDSASAYVDVSESGVVTMNAAGRGEGISLLGYTTMNTNDRIELWAENQTNTSNMTLKLGGLFGVSER